MAKFFPTKARIRATAFCRGLRTKARPFGLADAACLSFRMNAPFFYKFGRFGAGSTEAEMTKPHFKKLLGVLVA
ncbi:hypothetical protein, partial [Mesorhizobium sp. B1-1-7]|uniref:hypothetical protein n=1 Tax=Mesorhizobium sp. B1-1-7 TaxID=2589977 RepID=UPI001AED2A24